MAHADQSTLCFTPSGHRIPHFGDEPTLDRIIKWLCLPRSSRGMGGRVGFTELAALAQSLNWKRELVEDCWYDIVGGVSVREVHDMQRVAEWLVVYVDIAHSKSQLLSLLQPQSSEKGVDFDVTHSDASMDGTSFKNIAPDDDKAPDSGHERNLEDQHPCQQNGKGACEPPSLVRYLQGTIASKVKQRHPVRLVQPFRNRSPEKHFNQTTSVAVFDRLYGDAIDHHRRRKETKPPVICHPSPHGDIEPNKGKKECILYNKPTESFYAKLMGTEKPYDSLDAAPSTPRVSYSAAPGPPTHVPPGYVEGVARLRHWAASRRRDTFESTLRQDTASVESTPQPGAGRAILRLPVQVNGCIENVDVHLASTASSQHNH